MMMHFHIGLLVGCILTLGFTEAVQITCEKRAIDLVFVIDQSNSIKADNFNASLEIAVNLIQNLHIGPGVNDSRVGLVTFNDVARVDFPLTTYTTNADVAAAILNTKFEGGISDIAAGMNVAINKVFRMVPERPNVLRVMIIITDGMDITDVGMEHANASQNGIITYVVGVGQEQGHQEMLRAAGDPSRIFDTSNITQLREIMDQACYELPASHKPRECGNNYKNAWLDLIFIFDTSKALNKQDFIAVRTFATTFVKSIQVSQQIGKFSRVGIINMGEQAQVIANLTSFHTSADAAAAMRNVQYLGSNQVNLRDALVQAKNMIDAQQRPNVKKVIVVFSSKDEPCFYQPNVKLTNTADENPCRIAANLRENGHIIITIGMKFDGTEKFPNLGKIATECYSFDFDVSFSNNFVKAIARANCYCLHPYVQFTNQCAAYAECVYQQSTPLGYFMAQETCTNYNATLVDVLSQEKENFLRGIESNSYWIGAQYQGNAGYTWSTGMTMSPNDYTNWAAGQPNIASGDCVYENIQQGGGKWYSDVCDDLMPSHYFLCQRNACDTDNYCDYSQPAKKIW